jgi:hypothetical protein
MSAVPSLPPPESRAAAVAQLRSDLVRRFPGVVPLSGPSTSPATRDPHAALRSAPFLWVEVAVGQGGLSWLAAWTLLRLADDPLSRPALWIDTHSTLTPGDLGDLEGRLVVVRPADPHEAHVAADIALRAGSFSLVALEMHRALHPTPLARLARLAGTRAATSSAPEGDARTSVVIWGEPPPFVAPPSGIARTPFSDAVSALLGDPRLVLPSPSEALSSPLSNGERGDLDPERSIHARTPHTTDRLRPLDRAADRRASPPPPRAPRSDLVTPLLGQDRDRDDDAPLPFGIPRRSR